MGELMSDLVLKVKEVDVDGLDEGFWDKIPFLKNASRAVKKFMQRYEKLEVQIDRIEQQLDQAGCRCSRTSPCSTGCMKKT